jgi:hypothetical protein
MHFRLGTAISAFVLVAGLASCAQPVSISPGSAAQPKVVPVGCPDVSTWSGLLPPSEELGPIPADFTPIAVVMCTVDDHEVPGDGIWLFEVQKRADHGFASFIQELRKPSEVPTAGACTADLVIAPWFQLIGPDGQALRVSVPTTSCGKPQPAALDALRDLPFTSKETPLRQVETEAAKVAGCAMQWKNIVAIEAQRGMDRGSVSGPAFPSPPEQLTMCFFSVDPSDQQVGNFVSGRMLSSAELSTALAELEAGGPAEACNETSETFAVLLGPDGSWAQVELGGCHRFVANKSELRQASPALIALLQ